MVEAAAIFFIGFVSGAVSTLFIRRLTDPDQIRLALNATIACLFEFRLFADQPMVLLKAQGRLIAANARILRLLAVPSLFLILPYWGLLATTDGTFGRLPLKTGEPTIVTVQCRNAGDTFLKIGLRSSPGVVVETPALRISRNAQISWRVRPLKPASGQLQVQVDGRTIDKTISAGTGFQVLSDERGGTFWSFVTHPLERPIFDPAIESIRFDYPSRVIWGFDWLIWFCIASLAGASLPLVL